MRETISSSTEQRSARISVLREQLQVHEGEPVLVARREWNRSGGLGFGPVAGYDIFEERFYLATATDPFLAGNGGFLALPSSQYALFERSDAYERAKRGIVSLHDGPLNNRYEYPGIPAMPVSELEIPIREKGFSFRRRPARFALEIIPGDEAIALWVQQLPDQRTQDDMLLVLQKLQRELGKELTLPNALGDRLKQLLRVKSGEIGRTIQKGRMRIWNLHLEAGHLEQHVTDTLEEAYALGIYKRPRQEIIEEVQVVPEVPPTDSE